MKKPFFLPSLSRLKHLSSLFGFPVSKLSKELSVKHNKAFYSFDEANQNWMVFASSKEMIIPFETARSYFGKVKPQKLRDAVEVTLDSYENLDDFTASATHIDNDDVRTFVSGSGVTLDVFLQQGEGYILQSTVRTGQVKPGDYFSCAGWSGEYN